jgi:alpha-galactosidase
VTGGITSGGECVLPVERAVAFYRHGWHSWSRSAWLDPSEPPEQVPDRVRRLGVADPRHEADPQQGGSEVAAVEHSDGSVSLLGALEPDAWVFLEQGRLAGRYETTPGPWYTARGSEAEVFAGYVAALSGHLGRRPGGPQRLWSSWYGMYGDISEEELHRVLAGLEGLAFATFQVDDGWERAIGDWTANARFPSGMEDLAQRIRGAGFRPGLWLSPLVARADSEFAAHHPDLLLHDEGGDPVVAGECWGGPYHPLDPTHPGVLEHLDTLIRRVRGWGFGFLKLDFLYGAAFPGRRHRAAGREASFRAACEVMRRAAGEDCYLLACGAPVIASLGVFDGIRIGPDVAEWWHDPAQTAGARNAVETSAHRLWLRGAIDLDPDVCFFRTRRLGLGVQAQSLLRDLARITGFRGVSDPPEWLEAPERSRLAAFLEEAEPDVARRGRALWALDGREVDLSQGFGIAEPGAEAATR